MSFISGVEALDHSFHHVAGQDAKRRVAAPFVLLNQSGAILGYYTLSAYTIHLSDLPSEAQKKLPRYPLLPATLLGRLAISRDNQGHKLGRLLLMDALHRSWKNSMQIASVAVIVDAYDDNARAFYLYHDFKLLEGHAHKLFLPMRTIEKVFTRLAP